MTFTGKGGRNALSLTNPHKKNPRGVRSWERGGHAIGATLQIHRTGKRVLRYSLTSQGNEGVQRLAGSDCVLLGHLRLTVE
jgi:hypothetical protein